MPPPYMPPVERFKPRLLMVIVVLVATTTLHQMISSNNSSPVNVDKRAVVEKRHALPQDEDVRETQSAGGGGGGGRSYMDKDDYDVEIQEMYRFNATGIWSPGGVVGPTLRQTVVELNEMFAALFYGGPDGDTSRSKTMHSAISGVCRTANKAAPKKNQADNKKPSAGVPLKQLRTLLQKTTAFLVDQGLRHDDDCKLHLAPHHRAMCFLIAALDESSDGNCGRRRGDLRDESSSSGSGSESNRSRAAVAMSQRCAYRQSFCAQLTPCVQWTRGRFHFELTPRLLRAVQKKQVQPKVQRNRLEFAKHQTLFLHGEVGSSSSSTSIKKSRRVVENTRELHWMKRRLKTQELHMEKSDNIFDAFVHRWRESKVPTAAVAVAAAAAVAGTNTSSNRSSSKRQSPKPAASAGVSVGGSRLLPSSLIPTPTRDVFQGVIVQGHETILGLNPLANEVTLSVGTTSSLDHSSASSSPPAPRSFEYMSPLETISALYSLCDGGGAKPCVLLFHGDSLMRELFHRIIIHIRYGYGDIASPRAGTTMMRGGAGDDPSGGPTAMLPTHIEVGSTDDIVYRIFPTHDEILLLFSRASLPRRFRGHIPLPTASSASHSETPPHFDWPWTLDNYIEDIVALHHDDSHVSGRGVGGGSLLPLLHLVFCWDHNSRQLRPAPYLPRHAPQPKISPSPPPTTTTATNASLRSTSHPPYRERALVTKQHEVHIPLQLHGMTFWQKILNSKVLSALADLSTTRVAPVATAFGTAETASESQKTVEGGGRHLYIMTPLHHDNLHPHLKRLSPELDPFGDPLFPSEALCPSIQDVCVDQVQKNRPTAAARRQKSPKRRASDDDAPPAEEEDKEGQREDARGEKGEDEAEMEEPVAMGQMLSSGSKSEEVNNNISSSSAHATGTATTKQEKQSKAPQCSKFNVAKSMQWLLWLNDTLRERRSIRRKSNRDSPVAAAAYPSTFLVNSVALLDKSKGQFTGLPAGDHRHFSCHSRSSTKFNHRSFKRSTIREAIEDLIAPIYRHTMMEIDRQSFTEHTALDPLDPSDVRQVPGARVRYLCGGSLSTKKLSEWIETALQGRAKKFYTMQKVDTIPEIGSSPLAVTSNANTSQYTSVVKTKRISTFFSRIAVEPTDDRHSGGALLVAPTSPPKMFISLIGNGADRCRNSGDLYFMQLVLYDVMLKQWR